jgi:hypothetical protein
MQELMCTPDGETSAARGQEHLSDPSRELPDGAGPKIGPIQLTGDLVEDLPAGPLDIHDDHHLRSIEQLARDLVALKDANGLEADRL